MWCGSQPFNIVNQAWKFVLSLVNRTTMNKIRQNNTRKIMAQIYILPQSAKCANGNFLNSLIGLVIKPYIQNKIAPSVPMGTLRNSAIGIYH